MFISLYNTRMRFQRTLNWFILIVFGIGSFYLPQPVRADQVRPAPANAVSAFDLIIAMNTLRVSNGLPALVEDPIVDALAQSTAATMAANNMSWHIGNVRGRLAAAGYGAGGTVWGTENFAVGIDMGIDQIMAVWSDPDHMLPAVVPAYCNVGAGTAQTSDGRTYYILQAAYVGEKACGSFSSSSSSDGTSQAGSGVSSISQIIVPVKIATPDADGKIYHTVQPGQSYWSIAITYQITIHDLEVWNNTSRTTPLKTGERLFIPGKDTTGYSTPTPIGMVAIQAPDADGRIIHVVQPYQALITIADAYHVTVDRILALNGLQVDWPLRVGQKLVISPGNITPSPTLSAIEKLTPNADGKYYHTIQSGETLLWIASQYDVPLADLMNWNGLDNNSIIHPDEKLLLLITPPTTPTLTPAPATYTSLPQPSSTQPPPSATPSDTATESSAHGSNLGLIMGVIMIVVAIGGLFWWRLSHKIK